MLTVKATKYKDAREDAVAELYFRRYVGKDGVTLVENRALEATSDFAHAEHQRISPDNGRTWGEWKDVSEETLEVYGVHERRPPYTQKEFWNPVHKHYVSISMDRIFREGHEFALSHIWNYNGPSTLSDHTYIGVHIEGKEKFYQLVAYEDGAEFDPEDPINPEYFSKNTAYRGMNLVFADNGDIIFPIGVSVVKCCNILGIDRNEIFPSKPQKGLIVVRGAWNGEKYDFTYSRPVVISDLQSSRGVDEPTIALLKSGRIVVVFRGAYYMNEVWKTRIEPGTPAFKWYTWSDDGGKTFTPPMPWHFDDGEVIYSSASISHFVRSEKNGKLYWIGNITGHKVYENNPRWPLQIVEVDETYGTAKKESYTVIDTRREGEGVNVQLSNFDILQNRETGNIEVRLTKYSQFPGKPTYMAEPWVYEITVDD